MVIRSIITLIFLSSSFGCAEELRIDLLHFECLYDGQCQGDRICRATPERSVSMCVDPSVETLCTTGQQLCERPREDELGEETQIPPNGEPWEVCARLRSDREHCGECNRACRSAERCLEGGCRLCPLGQIACGEDCVDLESDAQNCGACAQRCADRAMCHNGECVLDCPATLCEVRECVDLSFSPSHCGACGARCDVGQACCGGGCLTVEWSVARCGACNIQCEQGQLCANGQCLTDWTEADFGGANLSGADFTNANLSMIDLNGADLNGADFTNADLSDASLSEANLSGASLSGANLLNMDLRGADCTHTNLGGALFADTATWAGVTWSNTICPDGSNSDDNAQTCAGHGL